MLNAALSLKKRAADAKTQQYLDLIVEGLGRIRDIVQKVLTFSPRKTEIRLVSIRSVIDKAHALMDHKLRKLNAAFQVSGVDAPVYGEPGELQQVFLNLFLNATDALAGVAGARLDVRLARQDDRIRIDVADNGCGMTSEQVDRAFDLFFTTKGGGEGSGLGLSIAHRIVSDHGGAIQLQSEPGRGSTFSVWLPVADAPPTRVTSGRERDT
ncbi:MAG: HAMP domain-containing sensor histidine kinase [Planctomycetota bacterium]